MDMILVSNYVKNKRLFGMLDKLAEETFGITLVKWKEEGHLGDNYIPYSYVQDGKVMANVSANLYHLKVGGKEYPIVQLGTVMTDPSVRGRGLSGKLMRYVISLYEKESLFIFLFANEHVMEFYPRFGFSGVSQKRYVYPADDIRSRACDFEAISWSKEEDRRLILSVAGKRVATSDRFSILGAVSPRTIVLSSPDLEGTLYYSRSLDAIACMQKDGDRLIVQDLYPSHEPERDGFSNFGDQFLGKLPLAGIREVECEFAIDTTYRNVAEGLRDANADGFFIRVSEPVIVPDGRRLMPHDPAKERREPVDLSGLRIPEFDHT